MFVFTAEFSVVKLGGSWSGGHRGESPTARILNMRKSSVVRSIDRWQSRPEICIMGRGTTLDVRRVAGNCCNAPSVLYQPSEVTFDPPKEISG